MICEEIEDEIEDEESATRHEEEEDSGDCWEGDDMSEYDGENVSQGWYEGVRHPGQRCEDAPCCGCCG